MSCKPGWPLLTAFGELPERCLDIRLPPALAQRVAAEEGSQKDGPVTVPLAQRQLSKSSFGLFGWILE